MVRNDDVRKAAAIASQAESKAYLLRTLESFGGRTSASILQEHLRQDHLRRATEGIAGFPQEQLRRATEGIARIPQDQLRRASEGLAQPYTRDRLREIMEQFSGAYTRDYILRTLRESVASVRPFILESLERAARGLEDQMWEAEQEGPHPAQAMSLGWWLASRPVLVQLELLSLALAVLAAFSEVVEDVSGEDIPDPLQSTTALLFAMTAFLLAGFTSARKPPDE